jgi:CarD family transcriptional regulator
MSAVFRTNERVVHPNHGVGCVGGTEVRTVAGQEDRYVLVRFPRIGLALRIPVGKLARSGLRRLSSRAEMRAALSVLADPSVALQGPWSRSAAEYGQKLNSGRPELLAEVVRDLRCSRRSAWSSAMQQEALLRLAEELAAVAGIEIAEARATIEESLAANDQVEATG